MDKKEYIEREMVITVLEERYRLRTHLHDLAGAQQLKLAKFEIDDLPSANVREVVRGHWCVLDKDPTRGMCTTEFQIYCSKCGCRSDNNPTHFCPNCGADMRGEEDYA